MGADAVYYKQSKNLLHQTIPVALGTDGVCSNNSADLFETMKTTALVQKMLNNDPCLLPARQVLEMATQAGLASQGRAGEAGMLRCGMDADLIALDRTAPALHPGLSPESDLVYAANGAMVRLTMVRGRILYENGRFPTMDIRRVYEEVERIVRRIAPDRRWAPPYFAYTFSFLTPLGEEKSPSTGKSTGLTEAFLL